MNVASSARIGVIVESGEVPAWVAVMIQDLQQALPEVGFVPIHACQSSAWADGSGASERGIGIDEVGPRTKEKEGADNLQRLVEWLDLAAHPCDPDPFRPVPLESVLDDHWGTTEHRGEGFSRCPASSGHRAPLATEPEVALDFTRSPRQPALNPFPRFGVWNLRHAGLKDPWGRHAGFEEVLSGSSEIEASLVIRSREGERRIADLMCLRTDLQSLVRTRLALYWRAHRMMHRGIVRLHRSKLMPGKGSQRPEIGNRVEPLPETGAVKSLRLLLRIGKRIARNKISETLTQNRWIIGCVIDDDTRRPSDMPSLSLEGASVLAPEYPRSWADPFPVYENGTYSVFFEEYGGELKHGRICVIQFERGSSPSEARTVLSTDYHLSHPFVFRWRGEFFLVPETESRREVQLFRARNYPADWVLEGDLLSGVRAVDATLHRENGRWWMFVNIAPESAAHAHDELHLFSTSTLTGPWEPHPLNPVVTDVTRARPAGKLYSEGGSLIRPGQDCSIRYGHAIVLNEVLELSRTSYREEPVRRIEPDWDDSLVGTHTLNAANAVTLVDGLRSECRRPRVASRIRSFVGRGSELTST